jgi:hypothetical protein
MMKQYLTTWIARVGEDTVNSKGKTLVTDPRRQNGTYQLLAPKDAAVRKRYMEAGAVDLYGMNGDTGGEFTSPSCGFLERGKP